MTTKRLNEQVKRNADRFLGDFMFRLSVAEKAEVVASCSHLARLKALKQAARQGWADVSAGRYADVADDQLEGFVGQLGRRAARQAKTAR